MWHSWSSQHNSGLEKRIICGLLNKLNVTNFDSVATKLTEHLTSCRRRGGIETIEALADSVALRAVEDTQRSSLYSYLCRRIDRELEMEDRRWTWLNDGTRQSLHPSFASILLGTCECTFTRALDGSMSELFPLVEFMGDLLLDGVFTVADVQDLVDRLFTLAEQGQEDSAVALSRFCRRVAKEPEGMYILKQLGTSGGTERVLEEDIITPRARYLLMAIVDLLHQEPVDAFDSAELRNLMYNLDGHDDDDGQECLSEVDSARTCVCDALPMEKATCESDDQIEGEVVNVDEKHPARESEDQTEGEVVVNVDKKR